MECQAHRILHLPSLELPSSILFPSSTTQDCVAALEKREEIVREKRRPQEKYKEEEEEEEAIYIWRNRKIGGNEKKKISFSCYCFIFYFMWTYIYKPVCVKRICTCVIHVFERVSLCQCVEGNGTETDEEDRRKMGRWGRGISREHQPQLSNGTTTFLTAAECNKDFSSCCIRLNSNRIRKKSIVLVWNGNSLMTICFIF